MKILVIGSCTGSKDAPGCPKTAMLTEADFDDPDRFQRREKELSKWLRPAAEMYTGRQHTQMMEGVSLIRSTFGADACDVAILSAGYGLIPEDRPIVPYNVTFKGMGTLRIKARGENLGVPREIRKLTADYPVVFFLLGDEYLLSTLPPLSPNRGQKFIHLGSPKLREVRGADVVVVPAGKEAEKEFHQKTMFVKGKLFNLLALGLIVHPAKWADALRDCNVDTLLARIRLGGQHV